MVVELTPDEVAFRASFIKRIGEAIRPCLEEAVGKNIRERAVWVIVSSELIRLASLYAIQLGSTAEEISSLARDCYNDALNLSKRQGGKARNREADHG